MLSAHFSPTVCNGLSDKVKRLMEKCFEIDLLFYFLFLCCYKAEVDCRAITKAALNHVHITKGLNTSKGVMLRNVET